MKYHMRNLVSNYQRFILILGACTCIFALCYYIKFSKVVTFSIGTDVNVHWFERDVKFNQSYVSKRDEEVNSKGFMLVSRYYEQQVGAAMNLLTLSKWAKTVGAFPVEPFVSKSSFHNFLPKSLLKHPLYFHDYFDIELWNKMCLNVNAMPLVSWNTFMTHHSGRFILVFDTNEKTSKLALVNDEVKNEPACKERFLDFEQKLQYYLTELHGTDMEIVRRVCISFTDRHAIHMDRYTNIIYGSLSASDVAVWFQTWKGIMGNQRIKIIEKQYTRNQDVMKMLQTSQRVVDDSKKYVQNVLKSDLHKYVAISFRSVQRAKNFQKHQGNPMTFFLKCISELQETVSLMNTTGMVFLAQDLGRFGDAKDIKYLTDDMISRIEDDLFQHVYNGTLTIEKWEQQFVDVNGGITDSGYIAAMQSEILKNSGCIVMFGGGSNFQRSVLYRYKQNHLNNNSCILEVCYADHLI